jgi:hypothetical protein
MTLKHWAVGFVVVVVEFYCVKALRLRRRAVQPLHRLATV